MVPWITSFLSYEISLPMVCFAIKFQFAFALHWKICNFKILHHFSRDSHCNVSGMDVKMLDVFENVEEITGYLNIEYWPRRNLCVFKYVLEIF